MLARWMVASRPSVWSLPVLSLMVMLRISASSTCTLRLATCCSSESDSSSWNFDARRALDQFLGVYFAPTFWQAAFIAGSMTLVADVVPTLPMLATISGASAGGDAPDDREIGFDLISVAAVEADGRAGVVGRIVGPAGSAAVAAPDRRRRCVRA